MMIQIDELIRFEVLFDPLDREEDFADDIRFSIHQTQNGPVRIFAADTTSILLTPAQAEQLAYAPLAAVAASRSTPQC